MKNLTEGATRGCKKKINESVPDKPTAPPPAPKPKHYNGGGCSQGGIGTVYKRDILTVLDLFDILLDEVKAGRGDDNILGLYGADDSRCFCIESAEPLKPDPKEDGDSLFLLHLGMMNRPY